LTWEILRFRKLKETYFAGWMAGESAFPKGVPLSEIEVEKLTRDRGEAKFFTRERVDFFAFDRVIASAEERRNRMLR
jgi:hypothetical protein